MRLDTPLTELSDAEVDAFLARELTDAARTDVNAFCTMVLRDERTGLPLAQAPVHEAWHDLADRHDRLLLWAAIEHGKTWQMSIARPLHELGKDPSLRVVACGRTQQQAQKAVRACKHLVESSAELHAVFPHLRPSEDNWSSSSFTVRRKVVSRDPSMQAVGLGGNIRGSRIDLLILDDVLDVENTRTRAGRNTVHELIQSKLFSRLTAGARVLVTGTAFHPDDALHRLAKTPGFAAYRYPVLDEAGQPRWPGRWPLERVAKVKELLGPLEAARQLFCQARSDEDSRFKWEWLARCLARGDGKQLCHSLQTVPPGFKVYTGVDLAVGRGEANDLTCLFDLAVHPDGTREVLNLEAGRWSGPDIVTRVIDHHRRYNSICVVENNAAQDFLVQFARGAFAVPILPFTTGRNKAHPEFGVESMAAEMAGGKWVIPSRGGQPAHPELHEWLQEMLYYSLPPAHTGDRLMASWFAREGARMGAITVAAHSLDVLRR